MSLMMIGMKRTMIGLNLIRGYNHIYCSVGGRGGES